MYVSSDYPQTVIDTCCHPFNWDTDKGIMYNLKHNFKFIFFIKSWAKKYNPQITEEMILDKDTLFFMDYAV